MANKKTQRDYFNDIIAMAKEQGRNDLVDFAQSRIDALDKKSANKKPTKTQVENESLKALMVDVLEGADSAMTVSEMLATGQFASDITNQKLSALLRQLIDEKKVVKTVDKKVSRFSVA